MRICSFEKDTCIYSVTIRSIRDVILNKTHPHINFFKYACLFFRKRYMYIVRHYTLYTGCDIEQNPSTYKIFQICVFVLSKKIHVYIPSPYALYRMWYWTKPIPPPYKNFLIRLFFRKRYMYIVRHYTLYTGCDLEQNPSSYKNFQICVFVLSKKIHVYI